MIPPASRISDVSLALARLSSLTNVKVFDKIVSVSTRRAGDHEQPPQHRTSGLGSSSRKPDARRRSLNQWSSTDYHQLGFFSGGYTGTAGTKPFRFGISTFGRVFSSMTSFSWMMPFR